MTVNKSRHTKRPDKSKNRWLVLAAIGMSAGCQSTNQLTRASKSIESANSFVHSVQTSKPVVIARGSDELTIKPVVFDQPVSPVAVATHLAIEEEPFALQSEELAKPVMTLADFETLALSNNPTIAELAATTQKAAGFRTQVSLRANPTVGYSGMQLADQGTDQHVGFISQTIVTADKLELNRRVLNEALRAQLLQLEAQKYRVATDVRVKFYDALAAQQRV